MRDLIERDEVLRLLQASRTAAAIGTKTCETEDLRMACDLLAIVTAQVIESVKAIPARERSSH